MTAPTDPTRAHIRQLETGVPGLDEVLGGGLPEYAFVLLAGDPGTGKTTLAHQMMFSVATAERPAVHFTVLGEPAVKMLRYQQQFSFFDIASVDERIHFVNLTDEALTRDLDRVLDSIVRTVERLNPSIVVVDSFRTISRAAGSKSGDGVGELQSFLQRLAIHLTTWEVTSFLVGEYSVAEAQDNPVFTIADGIIWLRQTADRNSVVRKMQVVKMRGQAPLPGLHTMRITDDGVQIFPRIIRDSPALRRSPEERLSVGVKEVDAMLGGGIPVQDSVLIAGPSGSGKSSLTTQFIAAGLSIGESGVIAVFEERPLEYILHAKHMGPNFDQTVEQGLLEVLYLRPLDLSVDEVLLEIQSAVDRTGARRVVIDSLSGFELPADATVVGVKTMRVLALNAGSSSLKVAIFEVGRQERRLFAAEANGIGAPSGGTIRLWDEDGRPVAELPAATADHQAAISRLLPVIRDRWGSFDAIGHRVVHGGAEFREPVVITDAVRAGIHALEPVDPDHAAAALAGIDALRDAYPRLPQVACFDTAFHARMPTVARLLPLPRRFLDAGIVRYGFHGLSYEFVTAELRRLDPSAADGRVIVAHLGSGASMAAIRAGIGIDTTMGFTPAGGLMMGTRPGDIDPGVLVHLVRAFDLDADQLNALVNREAGLLGVSGGIADMGELLELAERDRNASEAVALFCYTAKKHVGALCAVLGGVQTLAFTGGIGERAAPVRARICEGLDFLGIELDAAMNDVNAAVISSPGSRVCVRIIPTDEERMIARHTFDLVGRTRQDAL